MTESVHGTSFGTLLSQRRYLQWSLTVQLLRLPTFMTSFAFILVSIYANGGREVGGLMVSAYVLCLSVFAAPCGRLVDRLGPVTAISLLSCANSIVFVCLAIAALSKGPGYLLISLAGLNGLLSSGSSSGMRKLLDDIIPQTLLKTALSVDATLTEFTVVAAPLLVTGVVLLTSPAFSVLMMGVISATAAILVHGFRTRPVPRYSLESTRTGDLAHLNSPGTLSVDSRLWRNRQFWFWLLVELAFGNVFGTVETAVLPWAIHVHAGQAAAGITLTILSTCSILGGVLYVKVSSMVSMRAEVETLSLLATVVTGCIILALSESLTDGILAMAIIGLCTAPLNVVISGNAGNAMPSDRKSEGFAALGSIYTAGYGLGGLLLAILPLHWMMLAGGATGIVAIVLAPMLLSSKATAVVAKESRGSRKL